MIAEPITLDTVRAAMDAHPRNAYDKARPPHGIICDVAAALGVPLYAHLPNYRAISAYVQEIRHKRGVPVLDPKQYPRLSRMAATEAMRELKTIRVDVEPIAAALYDDFTANEATACAFGMLPARKMEALNRLLAAKYVECVVGELYATFGVEFEADDVPKDHARAFASDTSRKISAAIYGVAAARGQMVV